jgi:hypothetical protein
LSRSPPADGRDKDTLRNVRPPGGGGQPPPAARGQRAGAGRVGGDALGPGPPAPPRLAASPIAFGCVTTQIVALDPGAPGSGNVVFGRVVYVHVHDDVVNERLHIDHDKVATVGRMSGNTYTRTRTREYFSLPSNLSALDEPSPF